MLRLLSVVLVIILIAGCAETGKAKVATTGETAQQSNAAREAPKPKPQLGEHAEFEQAVQSASEEELQRFINTHPTSEHITEARILKIRLQEIQSNFASDPVVDNLAPGTSISIIISRLGEPASSALTMTNFSVVGERITWHLYRTDSRYYGLVRANTDRSGKVTKIERGIGIGPSEAELALRAKKLKDQAERRRASNKNIYVTIVNEMATVANIRIVGARLIRPMSLRIVAASVPGSNRIENAGKSGELILLPGDYSLTVNGVATDIIIPDRTWSKSFGLPTFKVYIQESGATRVSSYPD